MSVTQEEVLCWVNIVRGTYGLGEPLTELPKGHCADYTGCVVARALDAGVVTNGDTHSGTIDWQNTRPELGLEDIPLPEKIYEFVNEFDLGKHPELVDA